MGPLTRFSFIRQRFWPGTRFDGLDDLNHQVGKWLLDWANARHVESTGKVPWLVFEHFELPRLRPIPPTPFNIDDVDHDTVNPS